MSQFRTIEIDFDVNKRIEIERENFTESPNDVLRRILGIGTSSIQNKVARTGKAWSSQGVVLPHGTEIRMTYNGIEYSGEINDGIWLVDGEKHSSPSGAASSVAKTRRGSPTNLDGWKYWIIKRPGTTTWISLSDLLKAKNKPKFV